MHREPALRLERHLDIEDAGHRSEKVFKID
jgi:hypothetical protein